MHTHVDTLLHAHMGVWPSCGVPRDGGASQAHPWVLAVADSWVRLKRVQALCFHGGEQMS